MPRVTDIYAALPSITGKFELEYEGELRGADNVARDLIRAAVGNVFTGYFAGVDLRQVIEWFDLGGTLQLDDTLAGRRSCSRARARSRACASWRSTPASEPGAQPPLRRVGDRLRPRRALRAEEDQPQSTSAAYQGAEPPRRAPAAGAAGADARATTSRSPGNKKKYYN